MQALEFNISFSIKNLTRGTLATSQESIGCWNLFFGQFEDYDKVWRTIGIIMETLKKRIYDRNL
jgi:hypothetical protein